MTNSPYPMSRQPVLSIDATPDKDYVIRILKAYRSNCDCKFSSTSACCRGTPLISEMNKLQEDRAKLLDKAIKILETYSKDNEI